MFLEIVPGDPGAEEADVAKIFIGGTALDITSSDVTFTADATTDPSSPVPAKVTVTGLGLTSDTVTYDANGDISSTDDQETVTVTVGSEPPYDGDAITGAVYDGGNDVLEIVLGDPRVLKKLMLQRSLLVA